MAIFVFEGIIFLTIIAYPSHFVAEVLQKGNLFAS